MKDEKERLLGEQKKENQPSVCSTQRSYGWERLGGSLEAALCAWRREGLWMACTREDLEDARPH